MGVRRAGFDAKARRRSGLGNGEWRRGNRPIQPNIDMPYPSDSPSTNSKLGSFSSSAGGALILDERLPPPRIT